MAIETTLIQPVVDAILRLLKLSAQTHVSRTTERRVQEAIRELLRANPDEDKAEAALLAARAARLLSPDVLLAERMLKQVRSARKKVTRKKTPARRATRAKPPGEQ